MKIRQLVCLYTRNCRGLRQSHHIQSTKRGPEISMATRHNGTRKVRAKDRWVAEEVGDLQVGKGESSVGQAEIKLVSWCDVVFVKGAAVNEHSFREVA